jgi:hypothetical protein
MSKKLFGIIFPLFFILAATRGMEHLIWISYLAPVFYIFFLIVGFREFKSKELKVSLLIFSSFGLWALCSALWSQYPLGSLVKGIVFLISSWSLIIGGYCWVKIYSNKEFGFLTLLNVFLLITSIFSLVTKLPNDYWAGYGFGLKSYWAHQNVLASLIIFTIPGIFFLPFKNKRIRNIATLFLLILNVYVLILTHSRTSLVILIFSILLFTLLSKRFKILSTLILILTCIALTYSFNMNFHSKLDNYFFKTEVSLLDRKLPVFSATHEAAGHGGWKGLGYGVSDSTVEKNLLLNVHYHYEGVKLIREKGISIFALIEETGWVGLTLFLLSLGYLFYLIILNYSKNMDSISALMICVLFGMCLHAQFEGWWLGVGSVQFPLFMGIAGIIVGKYSIISGKNNCETL